MHHIDLVLDPGADAAVRSVWGDLDGAGLPSLAHHRSASNRPHTTLALSRSWVGGAVLEGVVRRLGALPMTARLGAPVVFGRGPFVLALTVVPTQGLIALHRALAEVLPPARAHLEPGAWTPHVTCANRLTAAQVGPALEVVVAAGLPSTVTFEGARHWDAVGRVDVALVGEGATRVER